MINSSLSLSLALSLTPKSGVSARMTSALAQKLYSRRATKLEHMK